MTDSQPRTEFNVKLGKYLRLQRKKAHRTQDEAAKELNISKGFVSNIELGLCVAPLYVVRALIDLYEIDIEHFLEFFDELQSDFFRKSLGIRVMSQKAV